MTDTESQRIRLRRDSLCSYFRAASASMRMLPKATNDLVPLIALQLIEEYESPPQGRHEIRAFREEFWRRVRRTRVSPAVIIILQILLPMIIRLILEWWSIQASCANGGQTGEHEGI